MFWLIAGLVITCAREPEPLTENSVITGWVDLDDPDYDHPAVINVVAWGPYGPKSGLAEASGRFIITGLGNGSYFLDYTAPGCGTVRQYGIQLFGNDTAVVDHATLFELPPPAFVMPDFLRITNMRIETNYGIRESHWETRLFFGPDKRVSCDHYSYTYGTSCNIDNEIYLYDTWLPFTSSTEVFVIGYSCNQRDAGYWDMYTNKRVFSTLDKDNHSNVISFIMP